MPKELFKPDEYEKYKDYLKGKLVLIQTIEISHSHTTLAYHIAESYTKKLHICDDCDGDANYMLYDRDHMAQTFISLFCEEHAHPAFAKWLANKKNGD